MFIKREEYDRLRDIERLNIELEDEVNRLADLISADVKDCKVGPWCDDCRHIGYDSADLKEFSMLGYRYIATSGGKVKYCKKHLHELCPEFESN